MQFTDSLDTNLEILRELLGGIPPGARKRAQFASLTIERAFRSLQKDHPKDPAVALGAAFAVFMIAQNIVAADDSKDKPGLIQLLQ
jgi:hypothetical protein